MRIIIHVKNSAHYKALLQEAFPDAEILLHKESGPQPADYVVAFAPPPVLLEAQDDSLKAILNLAAGVDALLANPALPKNVPIIKLRDAGMADLMLDYTLYALLHFIRSFDMYAKQSQHGEWQLHVPESRSAWPVGVLGLGVIGSQVAQGLAKHGFKVRGYSRHEKQLEEVECLHGEDGLNDVLKNSRILVNILPSTPETQYILNRDTLARLPPGAIVINPGRGTAIDLDDLVALLDSGHLRGAALDVFPHEPLSADSPLWHHPRIMVTPHAAAPTPTDEAVRQVVESIRAFERGEPPQGIDRNAGY